MRKELLNRSDLIKLYQPPIPKSALPTCNPFYTKTIVVGPQNLQTSPYHDNKAVRPRNAHQRHISTAITNANQQETPQNRALAEVTPPRISTGHMSKRNTLQSAQTSKGRGVLDEYKRKYLLSGKGMRSEKESDEYTER